MDRLGIPTTERKRIGSYTQPLKLQTIKLVAKARKAWVGSEGRFTPWEELRDRSSNSVSAMSAAAGQSWGQLFS